MRSIRRDNQFKKDVKRVIRRRKDINKLKNIIHRLVNADKLPPENKDHQLKGTLKDCRECHIEPGWLLIYRIDGSELCLIRTGSYSLKFVLPALVPECSYEGMAISDGGDAMNIYATLHLLEDKKEVEQIRKDLLAYCKLDTYAMVKLLEKLREV